MQCGIVTVLDALSSGDPDGVAFDLDLQIGFPNAGKLGDQDQIVAFPKYVERWVTAAPTGA